VINGAALSAIRKHSGLTISLLAEQSGVDRTTITKIERGQRKVKSPEVAKALAVALKVPIVAILSDPEVA